MQILPDIYLVNGYPYGEHQNSYVIILPQGTLMIDSGDLGDPVFDRVRRNARIWDIDVDQIDHMLITHAHFDHASHAAQLQRMGAKLVANSDCAEAMALGDDRCIGYAVQGQFETCAVDRIVEDEQVLDLCGIQVRCLMAPGHAQSCTVYEILLDGRLLWFVGDVVMVEPECQNAVPGWNGGPDYDRAAYLETLRRLCHLPCDVLLPGHGPAAIGLGRQMVEMAYEHAMTHWR